MFAGQRFEINFCLALVKDTHNAPTVAFLPLSWADTSKYFSLDCKSRYGTTILAQLPQFEKNCRVTTVNLI